MFGRLGKLISGAISGSGGESSSSASSAAASGSSAFGAGVPSEPAQLVESYSFEGAAGLAPGAGKASVMIVGFCESPVAGKYFVADARAVTAPGSGAGAVLSFNARRRTSKPVFHAPKHHTLLWFGAVGTTSTRYAAYLRLEDGAGVVFILEPAIVSKALTTSEREVVGKLEAREQYETPKEFHWSEVAAVGQRASGGVVVAPTGKKALLEISRPTSLSHRASQTLSTPLELPGSLALVSAAFLTRDGHEFAVAALADRSVHLLRFGDGQRALERCAEWRCGGHVELGGLWCARDCVLLLATPRQQQREQCSSGAAPVLYVLNVEHSRDDKRKLVPRRALTGLPVGTLVNVAAIAADNRRIALMDCSQNAVSVFQF